MTDNEIEHEIERVGVLVREYLVDMDGYCEGEGHNDMRVHMWMIGAVVRATDSEGETREITAGAFESSSRVLQVGLTQRLADTAREQ